MNILIFGATGMVGQGALGAALADERVSGVTIVVRRPTGQSHARLTEIVLEDLFEIERIADRLVGFDACFFCAGMSAVGMSEADYTRLTYDMTLAVAAALLKASPDVAFLYVSGAGTDSSEKGRMMWGRVKGRTENALLGLGFRDAHMLRPGFIQPLDGIRSRTGWYNLLYGITGNAYPLLRQIAPSIVTTTRQLGHAMISVARDGHAKAVLENSDISAVV